MTVTSSVSLIAERASRSVAAAKYTAAPCSNALTKIKIRGTNRNKIKYKNINEISVRFIQFPVPSFCLQYVHDSFRIPLRL